MTSTPRTLRGVSLLLGLLLVSQAGCWTVSAGLEPPSVTEPVAELDRLATRLDTIHTVLERDVARMTRLREEFFSPPAAVYAPPFPIDLFRHVSIRCLSQLPDPEQYAEEVVASGEEAPAEAPLAADADGQDEPPVNEGDDEDEAPADEDLDSGSLDSPDPVEEPVVAADEIGLACAPGNLSLLLAAIPPYRKDFAIEQLRRVDEVRTLRLRVERRIARLPRILTRANERVARQRAERRQIAEQLQARRLDYDDAGWIKAKRRMARYGDEIARAESSIEKLEAQLEKERGWLERSKEEMNLFLYDLAWLGLER